VTKLGYIGSWLLAGPFENDGKSGLAAVYGPEQELELAIDMTREYEGKDHKPVHWRPLPDVSPYGWTDLAVFLRPSDQSCAYLTTFVRDASLKGSATRPISLWAGASGAMRIFWNGVEVLSDDKYRDLDAARSVQPPNGEGLRR
jgi:hypothetical protein